MFNILWQKWESKLIYSQKNNKWIFWKYKVNTPDYIEDIDNKNIIIYDFKVSQTKTNYDDIIDQDKFKFIFNHQDVTVSEVKIISLDKKVSNNNDNCIYFRDFIKQKGIDISEEQESKINNLEADYKISKQIFNTNSKAQKILQ